MANHDHPNINNPLAPKDFDFEKFATFCSRGFSHGLGNPDGQVCIEAAISLCAGQGLSDNPTCVHPTIRAHAIRLNDSRWSSPEARAKGMCDYGLAQLGTSGIDGKQFAHRLAFLTITKLLPVVLRLVSGLEPSTVEACEKAETLDTARSAAIDARNVCRKIGAADAAADYADAAADYAADAAAYAADDADAAADARDRILALGAELATQTIKDVIAGFVQS